MTALALSSCNKGMDELLRSDRGVVIDFVTPVAFAKAMEADEDHEAMVDHIDVLIFNASENDMPLTWHERFNLSSPEGSLVLSKGKNFFAEKDSDGDIVSHPSYKVYLIANSSFDMSFSEEGMLLTMNGKDAGGDAVTYNVRKAADLGSVVHEDLNVHLTGLHLPGVPEYFLMDAVATDAGASKIVKLSDNDPETDIDLYASLERAASKICVTIKEGENVEFSDGSDAGIYASVSDFADSEGGLYYIRNMPYRTTMVSEYSLSVSEDNLVTTPKTNNSYFTWAPSSFVTDPSAKRDEIRLNAYVYQHSWDDQSIFQLEPCIIVNLPLLFIDSGDGDHAHVHSNSWYKIPLTMGSKIGRNQCFKLYVTINRAGAVSVTDPVVVPDLKYEVLNWTDSNTGWITQNIDVSQSDRPKYLTVNMTELSMHNASVSDKLEFTSSSDVSVTIEQVYYEDKFGQTVTQNASSLGISVSAQKGLAGKITLNSPVPANNAPRFIRLKVTNNDGSPAQYVLVTQYPLEYITNTQAWYSYREDFGGTTYEGYDSNRRVAVGSWNESNKSWSRYYQQGGSNTSYFFTSKVATPITSGTNKGKSGISYYYWSYSRRQYRLNVSNAIGGSLVNGRMYNIRLTSSSESYTLGIPKLDENGYTDVGDDNRNLVSPSFMIASQLGATYSPSSVNMAASHCNQYVEVYKDPDTGETIHLKDWRLPTEAEIKIIIEFQYKENAAMDEVLAGQYYWSATGEVYNEKGEDGTSSAVRCIRDAF